ncbi:MAG: tryptophan-rich sensory protein [Saprospiraceae bacterium]|nr:tryptophan-rich sensory protein [Saprospiraceae bacterium]
MKKIPILRILVFLIVNFCALALGGMFTGNGVISDWYQQLNQAPWTPPGWVFGAAWTSIMICFSFYMALLWDDLANRKINMGLYLAQWVLNVIWNPIFFYYHFTVFALFIILLLTLLIALILYKNMAFMKLKSILIMPYLIWLIIATSLNAYIVFFN